MTDDNLDDTQQRALKEVDKQLKEEEFNPPLTAEQIFNRRSGISVGISKPIPSTEALVIETWNAAIEVAAMEMDKLEFQISAACIRKLKK